LDWGTGRLTQATSVGTDGTGAEDASKPGYQFVMPGKKATITGNIASDAGSILQMHGDNARMLYGSVTTGVRFNQINIIGDLNLSASGDTLELNLDPFLLRPIGPYGTSVYEWGSIPMVTVSGALTGNMALSAILNDGHGAFSQSTLTSVINGSELAPNTWLVEYDQAEKAIYFHYNIMGYVPEPASFGMFAAGAMALRLMRNLSRSRRRVITAEQVVDGQRLAV
jgi:hypothetical protein